MAITKGSRIENNQTNLASGGTLTLASVVVGGSNRAVFVGVAARPTAVDGDDTIDTVVFNGSESLTQIADEAITTASGGRVKGFWLTAPTATTANVVVTTKNSACHICAMAQPLEGVSQSTPYDTPVEANGTSTTPAVTVTSEAGDLVLAWLGNRSTAITFTADGDTTEIDRAESNPTSAAQVRGVLCEIAGAASVSPSGVLGSSTAWFGFGFNINAATGLTHGLVDGHSDGLVRA